MFSDGLRCTISAGDRAYGSPMLEAQSHDRLKTLLQQNSCRWPHHLTLSRLVGRSLRRRDQTLIHLAPCSDEHWWLGLLVPLCLGTVDAVLVLNKRQRDRLLKIELPRLRELGFRLPCWEGDEPPAKHSLWLLDPTGLIRAHQKQQLSDRQLLLPQVDQLTRHLRSSMTIRINTTDWERLRLVHPEADLALMQVHERLTRRLFGQAARVDDQVRLYGGDPQVLRDLLGIIGPCPEPWQAFLKTDPAAWASWAELDHRMLQWTWHLEPLEPLQLLPGLLSDRPVLMLSSIGENSHLDLELQSAGFREDVSACLREPDLQDPLPVYAPRRQPSPNT